MVFVPTPSGAAFRRSRVLFAFVVGYLALGNRSDLEPSVGYAQSEGAPRASVSVSAGSLEVVGGALVFLSLPSVTWPLAVGTGI